MAPKYIVIEIQRFENGQMSTPAYAYDNLNSAEAKFHSVMASAAVSALPRHAAIMISDEGFPMRHEFYTHVEEEQAEET